jgi:antitoxin component YwqK of YwqJK toxin-antitoxin module
MCSRQYYLEEISNIPPIKELQDILNKSDGYLEEFYDNDTLQSRGELINHLPNGKWEYFDSNGELKNEGEYLNGVKIGLWKEFYNGSWHHQKYENGLRNGIHLEYYENGIIKESGIFVNDIKTGIWTSYYKNGIPKEEIDWTTGYIYFWNTWNPKGEVMVRMGNGIHKHYDEDGNPERYSDSEIVSGKYK